MADPFGPSWQRAQDRLKLVRFEPAGYVARADPNEPGLDHGRWSVTPDEGAHLAGLVKGCGVVEIGTGLGVSTRYLASTADWLVTCDIDPWVWREVWPDLAELDNIMLAGSRAALPSWLWPEAVFIDGRHTVAEVMADVKLALYLVQASGTIILHDTRADEVRAGVERCGLHMVVDNEHWHNGLGVIQVKRKAKEA